MNKEALVEKPWEKMQKTACISFTCVLYWLSFCEGVCLFMPKKQDTRSERRIDHEGSIISEAHL
ncbi:MAG: hypothetical protein LIP12_12010 [Clostridiales bacterium]|nr:hypothetical protein [Clostridiales bacterium]